MNIIRKIFSVMAKETLDWFLAVVWWMPGRSGIYTSRFVLPRLLHECGPGLDVLEGCRFYGGRTIILGSNVTMYRGVNVDTRRNGLVRIGNRVNINQNVLIDAGAGGIVEIGNYCLIG